MERKHSTVALKLSIAKRRKKKRALSSLSAPLHTGVMTIRHTIDYEHTFSIFTIGLATQRQLVVVQCGQCFAYHTRSPPFPRAQPSCGPTLRQSRACYFQPLQTLKLEKVAFRVAAAECTAWKPIIVGPTRIHTRPIPCDPGTNAMRGMCTLCFGVRDRKQKGKMLLEVCCRLLMVS